MSGCRLDRAASENNLCVALLALGERQPDPARLDEAALSLQHPCPPDRRHG